MKFQGITVTKRKDCNTWYARYRKDGKQHYISANTQKDCYDKLKMALLQKIKQEIKELKQPKQKQTNVMTFYEWYNKWKALYKQDVRETTKNEYDKSMKHLIKLQNLPIDEITSLTIQEELNKIIGKRARQKTYEFIKMLFDKAYLNELIAKNPISIIDKPKYTRTNGNALSSTDELIMESILKKENLDIFLICLYQGLRRGEALALSVDDIDFKQKTLTINKSSSVKNKISLTKNDYSNRTMPLFDRTIDVLKKYIGKTGRLFTTPYSTSEKIYNRLVSQYFPNKKYTIHSLRHTFITNCQEQGVPLHIIQKWVGHVRGSSVTLSVYTHSRDIAELENINRMNKIELKSNSLLK